MARQGKGAAATNAVRRRMVAASGAGLRMLAVGARAQTPRAGVVRLVLGFSAGGAADRVARVLAPELARLTGRSAIVDNVPGANGARAIARVTTSEPDGDTLLFATSAIAHPDNDAAIELLRPVILTSTTPMVLVVRASLPVNDAREFARYLAEHPETTYGSAGVGNATHLCAAELVERLRSRATHVPYNRSTPAFGDLLGGHIDFLVMGANPTLAQQSLVRMLAVTTRTRSRLAGIDHLPTIAETLAPGTFSTIALRPVSRASSGASTRATRSAAPPAENPSTRRTTPARGVCARAPTACIRSPAPDAATILRRTAFVAAAPFPCLAIGSLPAR
ncbi:MAG TPA: tripartite tricarboxylate transporter substrate-binding protein, partial [Casimicrobiaceae bacterium]|nr:tripartite tricarboxylate transporter substrate-binding protein [Casimicrobiaceae bacterium]